MTQVTTSVYHIGDQELTLRSHADSDDGTSELTTLHCRKSLGSKGIRNYLHKVQCMIIMHDAAILERWQLQT